MNSNLNLENRTSLNINNKKSLSNILIQQVGTAVVGSNLLSQTFIGLNYVINQISENEILLREEFGNRGYSLIENFGSGLYLVSSLSIFAIGIVATYNFFEPKKDS